MSGTDEALEFARSLGLLGRSTPESNPEGESEDSIADFIQSSFKKEPELPTVGDVPGWVRALLTESPGASEFVVEALVQASTQGFLEVLVGPMSKRARFVRDLILKQGFTTTDEVRSKYDPMAIRDLEERGITLSRETVASATGRNQTKYAFDPTAFVTWRASRKPLSTKEREELISTYKSTCAICKGQFSKRVLEADHRIPYDIVGNTVFEQEGLGAFQPLCPSCNTAKNHECNACPNKDPEACRSCYWARPDKYDHIGMRRERRLVLIATTDRGRMILDELERKVSNLGPI